jgi:hypothetical protein
VSETAVHVVAAHAHGPQVDPGLAPTPGQGVDQGDDGVHLAPAQGGPGLGPVHLHHDRGGDAPVGQGGQQLRDLGVGRVGAQTAPGQVLGPAPARGHRDQRTDRAALDDHGDEPGAHLGVAGPGRQVVLNAGQREVGPALAHPHDVVRPPGRVEHLDVETVLGEQTVHRCRQVRQVEARQSVGAVQSEAHVLS